MASLYGPLVAFGFFDFDLALTFKPTKTLYVGHFVLLEKVANSLTHLISNLSTTHLRRPKVESDILRYNPVLLAVLYLVDNQRARKKCLGRYAADVQAHAPQSLSLHARHAQAELRCPNCGYVATGATTNDDQVKAFVALSPQPSPHFMKRARRAPDRHGEL